MKSNDTIQESCPSWLHEIKNELISLRLEAEKMQKEGNSNKYQNKSKQNKTNHNQFFFSLTQGAKQPISKKQHRENEMKKHSILCLDEKNNSLWVQKEGIWGKSHTSWRTEKKLMTNFDNY